MKMADMARLFLNSRAFFARRALPLRPQISRKRPNCHPHPIDYRQITTAHPKEIIARRGEPSSSIILGKSVRQFRETPLHREPSCAKMQACKRQIS